MQGGARAVRCWLPCVDHPQSRHSVELRLSVASSLTVAAPGELCSVSPSSDGTRRLFTFKMALPVCPGQLAFAIGPFVVLPDAVRGSHVTHLAAPGRLRPLRVTVAPFPSILGVLENGIGACLPLPGLPSYTQCFLPAQLARCTALVCPGVTFFSDTLLVDERIGAEAMETHLRCAECVARQFFGAFLAPATPADAWLATGLAATAAVKVHRWLLGDQETEWRTGEEAAAVCAADDGALPPLCAPQPRWGVREASAPDAERLLAWKAGLVMRHMEHRVGQEVFAKLLRAMFARAADAHRAHFAGLEPSPAGGASDAGEGALAALPRTHDVAAAAVAVAAAPGAAGAAATRLLSTDGFMAACCKVGGLDRGEVSAFVARHVKCRGTATLSCAYYYIKRRNGIEVALRMDGPPAALEAAQAALAASGVTGWAPSCLVRVHEVTGVWEFVVSLGNSLQALHSYSCTTRFQVAGSKKGGLTKRPPPNPLGGAIGADSVDSPVTWVRCDPGREWLARLDVHQAEAQWIAQLSKDKDVRAQGEAVAALARFAAQRGSYSAVNAMQARLVDRQTFARVRSECARALGASASASTSFTGLDQLLRWYKEAYFDKTLGRPAANPFPDLAEAAVARACLEGAALSRGSDGLTPPEAYDLLLEVGGHPDDAGASHDGSGHTAAALSALARAAAPSRGALASALALVDRHLARDRLVPSFRNAVTAAALHTLAALSAQLRGCGTWAQGGPSASATDQAAPPAAAASARCVLERYLAAANAPAVRRAAADAALALSLSDAHAHAGEARAHCGRLHPGALLALLCEAAKRAQAEPDAGLASRLLEDAAAMLVSALNPPATRAPPPPPSGGARADTDKGPEGGEAAAAVGMEVDGELPLAVSSARGERAAPGAPPLALLANAGPAALSAIAWLRARVRDPCAPFRLRHAAFALLQAAGGRAPTLFEPSLAVADAQPPRLPLPVGESLPLEPAPPEELQLPAPTYGYASGMEEGAWEEPRPRMPVSRKRPAPVRLHDSSEEEAEDEAGTSEEEDEDEDGAAARGIAATKPKRVRAAATTRRRFADGDDEEDEDEAAAAPKARPAGPEIGPWQPAPRKPLVGLSARQRTVAKAEREALALCQHRDVAFLALNRLLHAAVDEAVGSNAAAFEPFIDPVNCTMPNSRRYFYVDDYGLFVPEDQRACVTDMRNRATAVLAHTDGYPTAQALLQDAALIPAAMRAYNLPRGEGEGVTGPGKFAEPGVVLAAEQLHAALVTSLDARRAEIAALEEAARSAVNNPLPEPEPEEDEPEELEDEEELQERRRPQPKRRPPPRSRARRAAESSEDEDDEEEDDDEEGSLELSDDDDDDGGSRLRSRRAASTRARGKPPPRGTARPRRPPPALSAPPARRAAGGCGKPSRAAFHAAEALAEEEGRLADVARFKLNRLLGGALAAAMKAVPCAFFTSPVNADNPAMHDVAWYVDDYGLYVPPQDRCCLADLQARLGSTQAKQLYENAAGLLADSRKIVEAAYAYSAPRDGRPPGKHALADLPPAADDLYAELKHQLKQCKAQIRALEEDILNAPEDGIAADQELYQQAEFGEDAMAEEEEEEAFLAPIAEGDEVGEPAVAAPLPKFALKFKSAAAEEQPAFAALPIESLEAAGEAPPAKLGMFKLKFGGAAAAPAPAESPVDKAEAERARRAAKKAKKAAKKAERALAVAGAGSGAAGTAPTGTDGGEMAFAQGFLDGDGAQTAGDECEDAPMF